MNPSESILDLLKKDESGAFRLLFDRYYDNLLLYCYHMVKNQAFLFLREYKKRHNMQVSFSQESETTHYDITDESTKEIELLYQTIDKLPEKCRQVFLMACLNDKTYQEIADELGTSINTVKTQMKTALKFLRENLQEELFFTLLLFLTEKD